MDMSAAARRRSCWLLLFAFLYATLFPSLGLASGAGSVARTVWVQLCNAATHEFIAVDLSVPADPDDAEASSTRGTGHCLLCHAPATLPGGDALGVAPAPVRYARLVVPDDPQPRHAPVWNLSLARAPPACA